MLSAHSILGGVIAHVGLMCAAAGAGRAQVELGHKLLGATGIDAGVQAEPGVYILARAVHFAADEVRDRNGDVVPLRGLDIDAWAGALGAAYVVKLKKALYFSFAVGAPVAKMSLSIDDPRVAIDREGLGDVYVLPLKVGWRSNRFDVVASYGVYAPTGRFEPRGGSGVGRGFWTQQISLGGAAFFSENRARRISLLLSYDINSRKQGIDITRGSTVQLQGGAGIGVGRYGRVGLAAYALQQVTRDRGAGLPAALLGQRDRVVGLGPEAQMVLPSGLRAELRAMFDFGVRSRPAGSVIVAGLTYRLPNARPQ